MRALVSVSVLMDGRQGWGIISNSNSNGIQVYT